MKRSIGLLISIVLLISIASTAAAQSGGGASTSLSAGDDLTWSTIDNGGGSSSGDGYTLNGTIGQMDAAQLIGSGAYTLSGGFWIDSVGAISQKYVFLPIVIR